MLFIPIALWSSLCTAIGLLHSFFPGLIPSAANFAVGGGMWVRATANNIKRLIQLVMAVSITALIIWFGLISFAIYTSRWEWAAVGFLSTGICFLVIALFFITARGILNPTLAHIHTKATAWSAAIPLQTMAWNHQQWWLKIISFLTSPMYGLYLLVMLPTVGALEVIKAIAAFGPTLDKWLSRLQEIAAAVTVVVWVLATVTMFQIQYGLHILDLVSLGLGFLFVGLLIALLLLHGKVFINVKDFIQAFGFCGLFLIGLMWFDHLLPHLSWNLRHNLQAHFDKLLSNVALYDFMAVLVILAVFALVSFMPWCRSFAGPLALGLLFLYTFSTDPTTPFYTKWEWWVGFGGLMVGLLFMWSWKTAPAATPANPGAPAPTGTANTTPAPAAHAPHPSGGHFPWKTLGVSLAVVAGLVLLGFIAYRISTPQAQASSAPLQTVIVQAAPAPAPTPGLTNCTLGLPDFSVKEDLATGEFKGLVTAHLPWQSLPVVTVNDGDTVEVWASGQVCGPAVGYAGPNGANGPAGTSLTRPDEFPVGDAWAQALVARIGPQKFQVGDHKTFVVPVGTGQQSIDLMDNFRIPELGLASGGFQVRVKITRKP